MSFKKILAGVLACSMVACTALTVCADDATADGPAQAYLMFSCADGTEGSGGHWEYGAADNAVDAEITANGQYTVSYTVGGDGAASIDLIVLQTNFAEESGVTLTVDSITVGDTAIAYAGPGAEAFKYDGGLRVNIYNTWGNDVKDIDNAVEVPTDTTVSVTFTVAGMTADAATEDASATGSVAPVVVIALVGLASAAVVASKKRA